MAAKYIRRIVALDGNPPVEQLPGALYKGESGAHAFVIICRRGAQALALNGSVSAEFVNGSEATISLTGSVVDGAAVLPLGPDCYGEAGPFRLTIFHTDGTEKSAIYRAEGRVDLSGTDTAYVPSGTIASLAELQLLIEEARNSIPSDYSALMLAVRDDYHPSGLRSPLFSPGGIANVTGIDYASDYYIRSGYMAAIPEDVLYIINKSAAYRYNIHQYAADKTWISALAIEDQSAAKTYQLAQNAYYVRFVLKFSNGNAITPEDADNAKVFVDWNRRAVLVAQSAAQAIGGGTIEVNSWVQAYGAYRYPYPVRKGIEYTYTNLSGAATNLWLYDAAGNQLIRITGGVLANESITFKAPLSAAAIGGYFNSSSFHFTLAVNDGLAAKLQNLNSDATNRLALQARHVPGSADGAFTLLHFSDPHADTAAVGRILASAARIDGIDAMICTGDMAANTGGEIASWWPEQVMAAIGNHDTAAWDGSSYDWTAVSVADRIAYYISPFEENWGITRPNGKSYYYKDFDQGIRLIVLDVMLYKAGGADATAQTAWLETLLSGAITDSLHVIIAIHAPHVSGAVDCNFSRRGQGQWAGDPDCNTPQEVISAVASAIAGGLRFVGYVCGHTHQDAVWDAAGDGTQLMYGITCAATASRPQWINSDQDRSQGQDAYNLITVDPARTLIMLIRGGGADQDNCLRSRRALCIDYSTGQIVSEQ